MKRTFAKNKYLNNHFLVSLQGIGANSKIMCLAIPGKIQSIEHLYDGAVKMAKVSFGGIIKEASLELLPTADVGDYVLVHVGVAISKVNEEEAAKTFEYLKIIGELDELVENTQVERKS